MSVDFLYSIINYSTTLLTTFDRISKSLRDLKYTLWVYPSLELVIFYIFRRK